MKKVYFIALILCSFLLSMPANAQFAAQVSLLTPHYYPGEVYFTDGHHEAFEEIELPRVGKHKLGVRKNIEDKERTQINASDIFCIKIWHWNFPDKVHTLYYVHAKKALMQHEHQWGYPIAGSDWGILFQCEQNYEIRGDGDLNFVKFVGGSYPDTPTLFYLKRPDWKEAQLVIFDNQFAVKNKVAKLFKENDQIAKGIKSGKLKPSDIQYILDEMAGGKTE